MVKVMHLFLAYSLDFVCARGCVHVLVRVCMCAACLLVCVHVRVCACVLVRAYFLLTVGD